MVKLVTYEVYTMAPNGGWYLHSRFNSEQRADAFDLGKNIEKEEGVPTKIIKETYDSNTQRNNDTVLYISPKIRTNAKRHHAKKYFGGGGYKAGIPSFVYEEGQEEKDVSFAKAIWVFVFILLVSFVLASLTSLVAVFILSRYTNMTSEVGSKVTFIIFIMMFIITSMPMSKKFIPWNRIKYSSPEEESDPSLPLELREGRKSFSDRLQNMIYSFLVVTGPDEKPKAVPSEPEKPKTEVEKEFKNVFETKELTWEENPFTLERQPPTKDDSLEKLLEPRQKEDTGKNKDKEQQDELPQKPVDAVYESYKKQMIFFVKELALTLKSEALPVTAFVKFGFNLMIVGAIDNIKEKSDLTEESVKELLTDSFLLLGIQPHLTDTFYEKIGAYTLNPAYLQMMHQGKEILVEMSGQSSNLRERIISAFKDWLKPISKEQDIITVMFTDITGSTSITQEVGDEKAYGLIKVHNGIVRKALQEMQGREIKHTGDGIMASFLSAINAVQAAVLIQRLVTSYNHNNADLPLNLKIGLSSGEPIREGQDLFGATVQIASRLCNHATSGQILVSKEVKDFNASSGQTFSKIGEEELKGLKAPIEIFKVEYILG